MKRTTLTLPRDTRSRGRSSGRRRLFLEPLENRHLLATLSLSQANITILGNDAGDESGISVSDAGDVNGDGFDDVIIGARYGDAAANAKNAAGETYLIWGKANTTNRTTIDLGNLGTAGIVFYGADTFDYSARAISQAGDVNGDGFDDFLIGAVEADAASNAKSKAGDSYLIFGKSDWSASSSVNLGSLGATGVTFYGADAFDLSGRSLSTAGDINGDGFDDILIGAHYGDGASNGRFGSGDSIVVFGKSDWSATPTVDLGNLGPTGVTIYGVNVSDAAGLAVSTAGDINGDGFDDLLIGARYADALNNNKASAGDSYIVFGKASWSSTLTLDLAGLGTAGVTIFGADPNDTSGVSLSAAGDVNGDGFDDVLIGATGGDGSSDNTADAGAAYLLFGKADWSNTTTVNLANLGNAGVVFNGATTGDNAGLEVSGAGDINADGYDDLLIGARFADNNLETVSNSGETYVIFGKPSWSQTFFLGNIDDAGAIFWGIDIDDLSGSSTSAAGDVNGDGFDDLVIGAPNADAANEAKNSAGESYVVFGGDQFTSDVTDLGTANDDTLTGSTKIDILVGHRGNDLLRGMGGADVLRGGQGNDILEISDLTFRRLVGGNGFDTVRLNGSGLNWDLTTRANNRTLGIEAIDLTGTGANSLTLNLLEVLNLSDESNSLTVYRDANDTVNRGSGWARLADETIQGKSFEVYQQGAATLRVQNSIADLKVELSASANSVLAGNQFTYAAKVTNLGPIAATGLRVITTLPAGLSFVAATSSSGCSAVGQVVTCTVADLAANANTTVTLGVRVASSAPHGSTITATVSAQAEQVDPTPADQSATVSVNVQRQADLVVTQTVDPSPAFAGGVVTFQVQLENRGPSDASGVSVASTLPSGFSLLIGSSSASCSANGQAVTCDVGALAAGTTVTRKIVAVISSSIPDGAANTHTVTGGLTETDLTTTDHTTSNVLTIQRSANLQLTMTSSSDVVLTGGTFTYAVKVVNAGPSIASGIVITDTLPTGVTFRMAGSSPDCSAVGQSVTCQVGDLAVNGERTMTIAVDVATGLARGSKLVNQASVLGNEADPKSIDSNASLTVTVNVEPDPLPWQNVRNRRDVNGDGSVSPIDALVVINELNAPKFSGVNGALPIPPPAGSRPLFDVNGDNFVSPQDALNVINFLNANAGGEGEASDDASLYWLAGLEARRLAPIPTISHQDNDAWSNAWALAIESAFADEDLLASDLGSSWR